MKYKEQIGIVFHVKSPPAPCISCSKPICSMYFMFKAYLFLVFHVEMPSVLSISCSKAICTLYFMIKPMSTLNMKYMEHIGFEQEIQGAGGLLT